MLSVVTTLPAYRSFVGDCDTGRLAHCYLLVGSDTILLDALGEACAYAALGGRTFDDLLWRKVEDRTHADVLRYPQKKKTFLTSEYDDLVAEVGFAPLDGDKRVFTIDNADKILPPLQSRLLKLLEEPPAGYVFLLKAATTAPLLQTVVSRARTIELRGLSAPDVERTLAELHAYKLPERDLHWAAEYAGGSVTEAEQLLSKPAYRGMCDTVWAFFSADVTSRDCLKWHDRWMAYEQNLDELLRFAAAVVRDIAAFHTAGESAVCARDRLPQIAEIAKTYSAKACVCAADRIRDALRKLASYVNPKAVVDGLLLGICEDKALYPPRKSQGE